MRIRIPNSKVELALDKALDSVSDLQPDIGAVGEREENDLAASFVITTR